MISLLTLNLWRHYDFEKRLKNITNIISEKSPDLIFLQEVQLDQKHSPFSQAETIQKILPEYQYLHFSAIYLKVFQQGQKLENPIQHGMAILSKYPIQKTSEFYPQLNQDEMEPRMVQCADILIDGEIHKFANIHFANQEGWAKNQCQEFLNYLESRSEQRIMAGDFNMFKMAEYKDFQIAYELSYHHTPYISYPKDQGTLDYILLPKKKYNFQKIEIIQDYLSDHLAIYAEIQ